MEDEKYDYLDLWIVEQQKLHRKEKEAVEALPVWYVRDQKIELISATVYDEEYAMQLPKDFMLMPPELRHKVYAAMTEEATVYTSANYSLFLILQKMKLQDPDFVPEVYQDELVQNVRDEINGSVLYEQKQVQVEDLDVYRVSYKSLAADDTVYNEHFWFVNEQNLYIGTFQCRFELYSDWLPIIHLMVDSIKRA